MLFVVLDDFLNDEIQNPLQIRDQDCFRRQCFQTRYLVCLSCGVRGGNYVGLEFTHGLHGQSVRPEVDDRIQTVDAGAVFFQKLWL